MKSADRISLTVAGTQIIAEGTEILSALPTGYVVELRRLSTAEPDVTEDMVTDEIDVTDDTVMGRRLASIPSNCNAKKLYPEFVPKNPCGEEDIWWIIGDGSPPADMPVMEKLRRRRLSTAPSRAGGRRRLSASVRPPAKDAAGEKQNGLEFEVDVIGVISIKGKSVFMPTLNVGLIKDLCMAKMKARFGIKLQTGIAGSFQLKATLGPKSLPIVSGEIGLSGKAMQVTVMPTVTADMKEGSFTPRLDVGSDGISIAAYAELFYPTIKWCEVDCAEICVPLVGCARVCACSCTRTQGLGTVEISVALPSFLASLALCC